MQPTSSTSGDGRIDFSVDPALKAAFLEAAAAEHTPAPDVLRAFMRAFVRQRERRAFEAEARRQSALVAASAADPNSDEAEVMRWIEAVADTEGWRE